jgi:hypothetical protein
MCLYGVVLNYLSTETTFHIYHVAISDPEFR